MKRLHTVACRLLELVCVVYLLLVLALAVGGAEVDFTLAGVHVHAKDLVKPLMILVLASGLRGLLATTPANAALALGSLAFAFGLGEGALRVLDHPLARLGKLPSLQAPSSTLGYAHPPGAAGVSALGHPIRINSRGLRDRERPAEPEDRVTRAVVLGDSFTFGMGVALEDTFHQQLEGLLAESGTHLDAVNGGVVGYNLYRSLRWFETEGVGYRPDLVVFAFFWDDPGPPHDDAALAADGAQRQAAAAASAAPRRARSYLLRFLKNSSNYLLKGRFRGFTGRSWVRTVDDRIAGMRQSAYAQELLEGRYDWGPFEAELTRLRDAARAAGAPLVVLAIPDSAQLSVEAWRRPQAQLAELCARLEVPLADPMPAFLAHPEPASLYLFPFDAHTSRAGHALMAEALAETIRSAGLLGS